MKYLYEGGGQLTLLLKKIVRKNGEGDQAMSLKGYQKITMTMDRLLLENLG